MALSENRVTADKPSVDACGRAEIDSHFDEKESAKSTMIQHSFDLITRQSLLSSTASASL
jgi:hypothetical protein